MKRITLPLIVMSVFLLLAGCASSPATRFYVLAPLSTERPIDAGQEIAVGVGPVEMPDYLDRPQIVTRSGQNELNLAEFDRWGESLKDNTAQVLAENLAVLLPSKKISTYPWKRSAQVNYQITVKITRFDHTEGGETVLDARWSILNGEGRELLSRQTRYVESPSGDSYPVTVAAMNRALAQFSREVANAINGFKRGESPSS